MPSPTRLTLNLLRRSGYVVDVVERWLPRVNRRRDLFGFGDVLAIDRREPGLLLVQCTSIGHVGDRLAKARNRPELAVWLRAGGRFEVWGWVKRGGRWRVKIVKVDAQSLEPVPLPAPARRRGKRVCQQGLFD